MSEPACHCGREPDAYEKGYLAESPAGRGQCLECALNRCDAYPGTCPNGESGQT